MALGARLPLGECAHIVAAPGRAEVVNEVPARLVRNDADGISHDVAALTRRHKAAVCVSVREEDTHKDLCAELVGTVGRVGIKHLVGSHYEAFGVGFMHHHARSDIGFTAQSVVPQFTTVEVRTFIERDYTMLNDRLVTADSNCREGQTHRKAQRTVVEYLIFLVIAVR